MKTFYYMNKMVISESRLREIVNESIYEVLTEEEFDEGFGHWLGKTFQNARNKWNNFKNDFKAGQNKARYDNRDYDSYSRWGDDADDIRNFGGREYSAYRYNLAADRNNNARQYTTNKGRQQAPSQQQAQEPVQQQTPVQQQAQEPVQQQAPTQAHPALNNNQTAQTPAQQQAPTQQQTPEQQQAPEQPKSSGVNMNYEPSDAVQRKRWAINMYKNNGIVPQNGNWNKPSGWKNLYGGKLTDDQKYIMKQYSKFLFEDQIMDLKNQLNELKKRLK